MLDANQIKDWQGMPEEKPGATPPTAAKVVETASTDPVPLTADQVKARSRRGQWIALALFAFVILIFTLTMTKMGANIMVRDL